MDLHYRLSSFLSLSCADSSLFKFYERSVAFIQKKTTGFNTEYYEIVICIGQLELVATGGFFGDINQNNHRYFLGSTITNLTNDMKSFVFNSSHPIYLQTKVPSYATSTRILNKYSTVGADKKWGFHSCNFVFKSYYLTDPLRLTGHSSGLGSHSDAVHISSCFFFFAHCAHEAALP